MSIEDLLTRVCTEDAVYWGAPVEDGYGGKTFAVPVDIKTRWEKKDQLAKGWDSKGNEITYSYLVYVLQDVKQGGYLYQGQLADLSTEEKANPKLVTDSSGEALAHEIKLFEKIPSLGSAEFVRRAFLSI